MQLQRTGIGVALALTTGCLDAGVTGSIVGSPAVELALPRLRAAGGLHGNHPYQQPLTCLRDVDLAVARNAVLPTCEAEALRDQLVAAGWSGTAAISGNGTGACP